MNSIQYAGFWRRWVAHVIDQILIQISSSLLLAVSLWMNGVESSQVSGETSQVLGGLALVVIAFPYFVICHRQWGRTVGKLVLEVKVVDATSLGPISWGQAVGRTLGQGLSWILLLLGYLMAGFDSKKRALHDRLAHTLCIRHPH